MEKKQKYTEQLSAELYSARYIGNKKLEGKFVLDRVIGRNFMWEKK